MEVDEKQLKLKLKYDIVILKIGGSLTLNCENLLNTLKEELNQINNSLNISNSKKIKLLIIPGGGNFANNVREIYDKTNLSNDGAHKLATLCTDLTGMYMGDISNIKTANNVYDVKNMFKNDDLLIFLPSNLILSTDELPRSWDVTSDSFAGYLAKLLKCGKLIIATDVDGIYNKYPEGKLLNTINAKSIKGFTSIDKYLPEFICSSNFECYVVNGNFPERIINILENKIDRYTKILK
ncbi:[5-(aminomethyl)furan-3-yl]methyl phosphate kinase [Methanococcus voltae]|uniref:Aspartate/glutamate/uridylate kinase n=1 Tax=Methanococcus voltae (strain ATCC BAA-1334 / A3) TaxID=456320 RepID=D7DUB0_METV3|nr:[5-(aminomethyl)furan-3-yl]methyl phosphate kinase [Methanococcus voltae]MCS3900520.1 aspartokinase-like uncharacterized kinase [Methanococcus voltae]